MVIFLGNTNSGDQNFLNPFIYHRDTSHYMVLKKISVIPFAPFARILTNTPVNSATPEIRNFCEGFCVRSEAERTKTEQKLRISGVAELRS